MKPTNWRRTRADKLVLFLGAGVSRGAGLPDWNTLLQKLAVDAKMSAGERRALKRLHVLDQARIVEGRLKEAEVQSATVTDRTTETMSQPSRKDEQHRKEENSLGEAVLRHITGAQRYSLAHSLLAALPAKEAVTTNYDTLFELAAAAAGRPVAVLPYQPAAGQERWLLKMHGCVSHPENIVLTRADYLRYADRRAALAGIVQALRITGHMLFVGFSLSDDNFHRIVDEVRKALRGGDNHAGTQGKFGTALLLKPDTLLAEMWRDDLKLVSIDGGSLPDRASARRLEIFLDYLLAQVPTDMRYVLDGTYKGILTSEEDEIRRLLQRLKRGKPSPALRASPAWQPLANVLKTYGYSD